MSKLKAFVKTVPALRPLARVAHACTQRRRFPGSGRYWEMLYASGGHSGEGSRGLLAQFKADVLNQFVVEHSVDSVIDLGCGDGNQLSLMRFPKYIGLDVSPTALAICGRRFVADPSKQFIRWTPELDVTPLRSDLALSLDVIYHLIEDGIFDRYMTDLFRLAERYIIIYSPDTDKTPVFEKPHVRFRRFSAWAAARVPEWRLLGRVPNRYPFRGDFRTGSRADFFVYERTRPAGRRRSDEAPIAG